LNGLIVGLRLGYNNEMGLNRNTVGWRGIHLLGQEWGPLVDCSLESDNDVIYWYYTGRLYRAGEKSTCFYAQENRTYWCPGFNDSNGLLMLPRRQL